MTFVIYQLAMRWPLKHLQYLLTIYCAKFKLFGLLPKNLHGP